MTTFMKAKLNKSDDQPNIDKYKIAANIKKKYFISKLIFLRIIILNFMMIRQLFQVKNISINVKCKCKFD